eukprot:scaffold4916_cov111-Cylindrotheca_fusiformis.AAC.2
MSEPLLTRESLRSLTNINGPPCHSATTTQVRDNKSSSSKKKKSSTTKLSEGMMDLQIDQSRVHAGQTLTGTIQLQEKCPTSLVKLVFEGIEYTVVALKQSRDNNMGLEYLKKHTSEQHVLTKQQALLDLASTPSKHPFRFVIPSDLPGTMKCVLSGTDPQLPSQCHIYYTITASIFKNTSMAQVSKPIIVAQPPMESTPLNDSSISVSVMNPVKSVASVLFQCGNLNTIDPENEDEVEGENEEKADATSNNSIVREEDEDEGFLDKKYQLFSLSCDNRDSDNLFFAGGQIVSVHVTDWLGRQLSGIWMVQLVEEISWWAKGRSSTSISRWNLFANHHELPTTLQRSYESSHSRLLVQHKLIVYLTTNEEDPSKEVLACTEPFPITIVSNTRGWNA